MHNGKIKVLYILGHERCGSTLLHRVLGEIDGFVAVGETRELWRSLEKNKRCGCKLNILECEFWRKVIDEAFGGIDQIDLKEMARLTYEVGISDCLLASFPGGKQLVTSRLREFLANLEKLYQGIQAVSGSKVIVDSSKISVYGRVLKMLPTVDPYFIHLIRDPRSNIYSLLKRKNDVVYRRYNSMGGSLLWNKRCLTAAALFQYPSNRYLLLRYEDFINRPQEAVERILNLVQEKVTHLPFQEERKVELKVSHTPAGSPSRFKTGIIELQPDEQWKEKLKPKDKAIATTLTLPLLLRYGYLGGMMN